MPKKTIVEYYKYTPLQTAIHKGDFTLARKLIVEDKVNVNETNSMKETALHLAARIGNLELVKLLVENNAIVDSKAYQNETPLFSAVAATEKISTKDAIEVVKFLLSNGADINIQNKSGYTSLHAAIMVKNIAMVKTLMDNGADPKIETKKGHSAEYYAQKSNIVDIQMHIASKKSSEQTEEFNANPSLFSKIKNIFSNLSIQDERESVNDTNKDGITRLHYATVREDLAEIQRLLDLNANIEAKDINGFTPLILAANLNMTKSLELLLEKKANIEALDNHRMNALHLAAGKNYWDTAHLLLEKGANVNALFQGKVTPIHIAVSENSIDVVNELLEFNADLSLKDPNGFTAFDLAIMTRNLNLVEKLYRKSHDIFSQSDFDKEVENASIQIEQIQMGQFVNAFSAVQSGDAHLTINGEDYHPNGADDQLDG